LRELWWKEDGVSPVPPLGLGPIRWRSKSQQRNVNSIMKQSIIHIALVVKDYDEAIAFYTEKLHFTLVEDTYQPEQDKRWVVVAPPGSVGTTLLLARAPNRNRNHL